MEENKIEDLNDIGQYPEDENDGSDNNRSEYRKTDEAVFEKKGESAREEYDRLIRTRFKEFYCEDTQKLINRRFRKYRVLEEKYRILEEDLKAMEANVAESEKKLSDMKTQMAEEGVRIAKETEERVFSEIAARRLRPSENAVLPRRSATCSDVSRLTKSERAKIARRAADGEKICF